MSFRDALFRALGQIAKDVGRAASGPLKPRRTTSGQRSQPSRERRAPKLSHRYPGDYQAAPPMTYDPHPGKLPDPGEVVWAWVPFEEDYSQGKDRPVLIVGRDADWLLGLPLSSKNHTLDAEQEASENRYWIEIGRGPWDTHSKKPSAVRVNRVVRIHPEDVRRVGGRLNRDRFDQVSRAVRQHWR